MEQMSEETTNPEVPQDSSPVNSKGDEESNETNEGFSLDEMEKMNNLNSNLDDLFSKIAMLTSEIEKPSETPEIILLSALAAPDQSCVKKYEARQNPNEQSQDSQYDHKDQPEEKNLSMRQFQLGKTIGQGKFGTVHECKHLKTGMVVALKKVYRSSIEEYGIQKEIQNEVMILAQVSHPNIVQLYGFFGDDYHVFIIMEYAHGKTLEKTLRLGPEMVSDILMQVLHALEYLHSKNIIHRDIKPENLVYQNGVVKLLDFGYATYVSEEPIDTLCGTLDYASPQILQKLPYKYPVDLWAVGVLTYQLLTGEVPFPGANKEEKIKKITQGGHVNYPETVPEDAQDFISLLLKKNPEERMSVQECLQHAFAKRGLSVPQSCLAQELEMQL